MRNYDDWFKTFVGRADTVLSVIERIGRRWFHGIRRCREFFADPPNQDDNV